MLTPGDRDEPLLRGIGDARPAGVKDQPYRRDQDLPEDTRLRTSPLSKASCLLGGSREQECGEEGFQRRREQVDRNEHRSHGW